MDAKAFQFETIKWKEVILFFVLPLILSAALFFYAFHLKEKELIQYAHPAWRITVIAVASIIGFLSIIMLWMTFLIKTLLLFGLTVTKKNFIGGILLSLGGALFVIPVILVGNKLRAHYDSLEEQALSKNGIMSKAIIAHYERHKAKQGHFYEYYFNLYTSSGKVFEETITRKHDALKVGDTVSLIYLNANPGIFREVE
jgi:hypothetical protein